jgi:hypothetical protein
VLKNPSTWAGFEPGSLPWDHWGQLIISRQPAIHQAEANNKLGDGTASR